MKLELLACFFSSLLCGAGCSCLLRSGRTSGLLCLSVVSRVALSSSLLLSRSLLRLLLSLCRLDDLFSLADDLCDLFIVNSGELAEIDSLAVLVNDIGLRERNCESLVAGDLAEDHARVARRMHELVSLAEDHDDPVTADLATARSAFHEKAAWMLRAITKQ